MTIYKDIDANLRSAERAFQFAMDSGKRHIKKSRDLEALQSAKTASLILAGVYEARLHWLLWHPSSRLTDQEKKLVIKEQGLVNKWEKLFKIALANRVSRLSGSTLACDDVPEQLPEDQKARYYYVRKLARRHLRTLIDARNSLAHGEWSSALNRSGTGLNPSRTKFINRLTMFRVVCTANLLDSMWKLYFDALVTTQAFERDFQNRADSMRFADMRIKNANEKKWESQIRRVM